MARLMQQAKLMLGAGGSTHWERCFSQLPALVVTVADNQRQSTQYLDHLGACIWLGDSTQQSIVKLADAIARCWQDEMLLQQMAQKASELLPHQAGTPAVVKAVTELMRL
jgi:spore coat polysaccharide biosynthesis predicted glycosyltransferase SpsG